MDTRNIDRAVRRPKEKTDIRLDLGMLLLLLAVAGLIAVFWDF